MQAYRGRDLAAMLTKRRLALTALLGVCLALGGCSSFAGVVSDTWPTWAGGMPKDVPPRPGAPGYEEFIAHQQRQGVAAGSAADPTVAAQAGAPGPGSASPLPKVVALAHVLSACARKNGYRFSDKTCAKRKSRAQAIGMRSRRGNKSCRR